ncbi:MAG: hypothetical protein KCHDKBKB_00611 [Elusimicrobia bacterium]|nr:hypothetical protein [Elusimicrobiota bacterium]
MDKQAFIKSVIEGFKQFLRIELMAVIPVILMGLHVDFVAMTASVDINWMFVQVVAAIAGLSFIDKALHAYGKETENKSLISGLTRF